MLVLAMEFSRGTAAHGRRSLTAEQEQLGHAHGRLWDSLEQALGLLPRPGGTSPTSQ
jgi:HAMP domain-containing protein